MKRREFCKSSLLTAGLALAGATGGVRVAQAATGSTGPTGATGPSTPADPAAPPEVTGLVAAFIVGARFEDIPPA